MTMVRVYRLALLQILLLVFGASLKGQFLLWDDAQHLPHNPHLRAGDFAYFWSNAYYGFFVPVTYTLWTALFALSEAPWIFHALNLILHALNTLMVFELLRRLVRAEPLAAFLGAMVFMLHPLQVEPVAWISGARDLLAAGFGLAATLMLVRASAGPTLFKQSSAGVFRQVLVLTATLLFTLGLLSKPSLAPLPVALLVMDYFRSREDRLSRQILGLWTLIGAAVLAYTVSLQGALADPRLETSWAERLLVATDAAGFYVKSLLLPWPLSFSYDRTIESVLSQRLYLFSLIWFLAGVAALVFLARKFGRAIYGYALFAAVLMVPVSGLVPFAGQAQSTVFDRYMYLPMQGVALIVGAVASHAAVHCSRFGRWGRVWYLVPLAVLAVMAVADVIRVFDWRDDRSLTESALHSDPANYIALNNLGLQEMADGNLTAAENRLRAAWESRPTEALAPANLAHVLWLKKDIGGILQEIKPLTETAIFLHYNRREPAALALIHRMTARALNATLDREGAERAYAKARGYHPGDSDLREEFEIFQQEE